MARIRTVKPDFLRHELLQKIEVTHGALRPMLVFLGLWTQADKEGRFPWRPRLLKLDILPFVPFDMDETLELLEANGFIRRYEVRGESFGLIATFKDHQRVSGKEAESPARYPRPLEKLQRNDGEATENPPGVREGNGERSTGRELKAGTEGGPGETVETVENVQNPETPKAKPAPREGKAKAGDHSIPSSPSAKERRAELRAQAQKILATR